MRLFSTIGLLLLAGSISMPAAAQDEGVRAGKALGELLFGDHEQEARDAYRDEMLINAQIAEAYWAQRNRETEARLEAITEQARTDLSAMWQALGAPKHEADAVAATFVLSQEQFAFNARAEREGWQATQRAAVEAYLNHDYLKANQLMIASFRVFRPQESVPQEDSSE